jgi:signal transduction histidine kinase
LTTLTLTSLNQYFGSKRFTAVSSAAYFAASVFYPAFAPFIALFCFDFFSIKLRAASAFALIPIIAQLTARGPADTVYLFLLAVLAVFLQYGCENIARLSEKNNRIRDDSAELNRMLTDKNRNLIEKQNYEIHLVTLKERNRIAREIHDNVGHILSRSLLQTGALQTMNKDELLSEHLSGLKDTLSLAMDSIRTSVHGLRDESVDLYDSIRKMTERLDYEISIDYDMAQDLPNDIKYCFLSVLKESLTNIARHSDADRVKISVQEHPAICQLLVHDNGTKKPLLHGSGMGLVNMEDRVAAFNGHFSASYQNGFRIFISIPKQEDNIPDENNNS